MERQRRQPEPEGLDYVKVGLGLVFVFGAFVFGIIAPPGTLVVSFGLMIPAVALIASALQETNKLSELAGGGHLSVDSADGTLRYSLPGRRATELDGLGPPT
jgi:hypothetical protein